MSEQITSQDQGRLMKRMLLVLLVLINGILLYFHFQQRADNQFATKELKRQEKLVAELEEKLNSKEAEIDEYQVANAELRGQLKAAQEQIAELKEELERLRNYNPESTLVKNKLAELAKTSNLYAEQITTLLEENKRLTAENQKLREAIEEERKRKPETTYSIKNISLKGISGNDPEAAEKLKICFDIYALENIGEKDFGIKITGPGNELLSDSNNAKVNVIEGLNNICLFQQKQNYPKGAYMVEVYDQKQLVRAENFELK